MGKPPRACEVLDFRRLTFNPDALLQFEAAYKLIKPGPLKALPENVARSLLGEMREERTKTAGIRTFVFKQLRFLVEKAGEAHLVIGVEFIKRHQPIEKKAPLSFDIERAVFTGHALGQFVLRTLKHDPRADVSNPVSVARKLLGNATEEEPETRREKIHRVRRTIKHGFKPVRCFIASGWRFIISEENERLIVITIERQNPTQN